MQFMQMPSMQKNNSQQQMMSLLQATLARGGKMTPPQQPVQPGAAMPGGAMNVMPMAQQQPIGLLSGLFNRMRGASPLDPNAGAMEAPSSETAIY